MKIAIDHIWNPFKYEDVEFLFNFDYEYTQNVYIADIVIQSIFNNPLERKKEKQFLIQICGEPENNINNHYDLTLGNNFDSEKTVYFPYFVYNLYSKQNTPVRINLLLERPLTIMQEKEKFCLFISSRPTDKRINIINELMKYKHVDCLGNVLNNGKNVSYKFWSKEFLDFINQYKFMICFENSDIFGYASEKPINAYAGGAIPIYSGSKEIYSMINKEAFIINDDINQMIEEIKYLDNDDEAYFKKWSQPFFINNLIPEDFKLENIQQKIYSRIKCKLNI